MQVKNATVWTKAWAFMQRQVFLILGLNVPLLGSKFDFVDSEPRELFVSICTFLSLIGIGIYPHFVLSLSVDNVQAILSNYLVFINVTESNNVKFFAAVM